MNKVMDWVKLVLMVILGINWIIISDFGMIFQLLGMISFIASVVLWCHTESAKNFINMLMGWNNED